MEFIQYPDSEALMMNLAQRIANQLESILHHEDRATLAVPGGTTPGPVFDELSAVHMPWDRVDVVLTDERWVPEASERSNTALLRRRLLQDQAGAATLLPLRADTPEPEEGLPALEARLASHLPLSVALLGMGTDMHTASIFPGADRLADALTGDALLYPMRAPGAPEPRITLSAKVLNGATHKHLLILGPEKREALERARHLQPNEAPLAALLSDMTVHWAEK